MYILGLLIFVIFMLVGFVGNALGLTTTIVSNPTLALSTDIGWLPNFLEKVWDIVTVFSSLIANWVWSFLQLQFFASKIPATVNGLIMAPVDFIVGLIVVRIGRGN